MASHSDRIGQRGFSLLELILVMGTIAVITASSWVYMRPADQQAKVVSFVADVARLRADIKRFAAAGGNSVTPYTGLTTAQLYAWSIVPTNMAETDTTTLGTPWSTLATVRTWPLVTAAGALLDVGGSAFNVRIQMPADTTTRRLICAPLVTSLAATWPQMSYAAESAFTAGGPGTVVIGADLPATPNRISTVVTAVCSQATNFVLVVADA